MSPAMISTDGKFSSKALIDIPEILVPCRVETRYSVLLYQDYGTSETPVSSKRYVLSRGEILCIPAKLGHTVKVHRGSVLLPLCLPIDRSPDGLRVVKRAAIGPRLRALIMYLVQAQYSLIRSEKDLQRLLIAEIDDCRALATELPMPTSDVAVAVAEMLLENPGDAPSVDDIAQSVFVSPRKIQRVFREETGMSFRDWRLLLRLETAEGMLRSGDKVEIISQRLGYSSASTFGRVYKKSRGFTSGHYARTNRKPQL